MQKEDKSRSVILQGNSIIAEAALVAGCRFFAGYPITPATEIAEYMAAHLPKKGGIYIQMEDELGSINAAIGAAWNGKKAMTATSGPGFTLVQEGIGYAAMTETPLVVVDVMRGGPATGQPTLPSQQDVYQAKYGSHGDYETIVFCPSSGQELYDLTIKAFNYAEIYRVPVIILSDEVVSHSREKITIPAHSEVVQRQAPQASKEDYQIYKAGPDGRLDGMPAFGQGYKLLVDSQSHKDCGNRAGYNPPIAGDLVKRLCRKITDAEDAITDLVTAYMDDAESVVFAYGSVARSARRAVEMARDEGLKVGFVQSRILWPFPEKALRTLCTGVNKIFVPELNVGKMVREVRRMSDGQHHVISMPLLGGLLHTPNDILQALKA